VTAISLRPRPRVAPLDEGIDANVGPSVVEQVPAVVYVAEYDSSTGTSRLDYISPFVEDLSGVSAADLTADSELWLSRVHPDDRAAVILGRQRHLETGAPLHQEYRISDGGGRTVWVREDARLVRSPGSHVARSHGVMLDVSAEHRARAFMAGQARVLTMVAEDEPLAGSLAAVVGIIEAQTDGLRCSIMLADESQTSLLPIAVDSLPAPMVEALQARIPIREGAGSCGTAAHRGTSVITRDVAIDPLWADYRELARSNGIAACWSVPIRSVSGLVLGTFAMYLTEPGAPRPDDLELAQQATHVARIAIERDRARRRLDGYRVLVERLPAIAYIDDADALSTNRYIGPGIEGILGFSVEEWRRDPRLWHKQLHPEDRERAMNDIVMAHATNVPLVSEYRLIARDGREVWMRDESITIRDAAGNPTSIHGVMLDVTDQKHAERALRASERRFREMLQDVELAAVLLDVNGTVQFCNQFLLGLTGWSEEDVIGASWSERFQPGDVAAGDAPFQRDVATGAVPRSLEREVVTRAGDRRLIRWSNTDIHDVDGAIVGTASIGEDVTERRHLEDKLRQSQKMDAVGQLAGGIAHDFNNLMTAVSGYADLALTSVDQDDPIRSDLIEITNAADRATSLTRQLLAFSRRQPLRPTTVDLRQVVREIEPMLRRLIGEQISLATRLSRRSATVRVDRSQIEQVIVNLVVNARDAMPAGGNLQIDVSTSPDVPEADSGNTILGPNVVLTIADTGSGMTADVRSRAFDPFFTTKGPNDGTGLGLSTVYGIVQQSGGAVAVESDPGRGATFRVVLPGVDAAIDPEPGPLAGEVLAVTSRTILVVEDEHAVRALLRRILEGLGNQVLSARDGAEALEMEAAHAGTIDLLVTDVIMPNMRGREIAERIAARRPGIAILFVSGYPQDDIVRDGVLDPDVNFLQKPFDACQLIGQVGELLGTRRLEPDPAAAA
jgi:two-component system cell cycle sensor histidine kinase/response regulator CckA